MLTMVADLQQAAELSEPARKLSLPSLSAPWPQISTLGLSADALSARRDGIGGSDANIIMSGDAERVLALWQQKRGEAANEDLSSVLPVMLGCWTESFNRQWYAKQTALAVTEEGSSWTSIAHPWRKATIDGLIETKPAVWEAKHTSAFAKPDEVLARYMPQLQHNMSVCGVEQAVLSVIYGNHKWEAYEIASDWLYQDELFAAEERFWTCVLTGEPPSAIAPPPTPKPIAYRELCLTGNNMWASAADDWLAHVEAAKKHAAALKTLKELIPDDVSRAFGHGLEAKRSKSGAITVKGVPQ